MSDIQTSIVTLIENKKNEDLTNRLTPLIEWRKEEEREEGPLSRTSHTPQRVENWDSLDRGGHGIVFVDDKEGLACKFLYNKNEAEDVKKRYELLKDVLPLTKLLYAKDGIVVTEYKYGNTIKDKNLQNKYQKIAEEKGVRLDKGEFNIVSDEDGNPFIIDW